MPYVPANLDLRQGVWSRSTEEINRRERRHTEELRREQELLRNSYYYDPWWPGYPGFGWNYDYPFRPNGGFYWRR